MAQAIKCVVLRRCSLNGSDLFILELGLPSYWTRPLTLRGVSTWKLQMLKKGVARAGARM